MVLRAKIDESFQGTQVERWLNSDRQSSKAERVGIGGFTSFSKVSGRRVFRAQLPTTFLEDGSAVTDHRVREMTVLTINGVVGDEFVTRSPLLQAALRARAEIGVIAAFAPDRTAATLQRVDSVATDINDAIAKADAVLRAGEQTARFLGALQTPSPLTERFLKTMERYHESDGVFAIEMQHRTYENMMILSFEANEDNIDNAIEFTMEAGQVRIAQTILVPVVGATISSQVAPVEPKPPQAGTPVEESFASALIGGFSGP